jgi:hypothetical protein
MPPSLQVGHRRGHGQATWCIWCTAFFFKNNKRDLKLDTNVIVPTSLIVSIQIKYEIPGPMTAWPELRWTEKGSITWQSCGLPSTANSYVLWMPAHIQRNENSNRSKKTIRKALSSAMLPRQRNRTQQDKKEGCTSPIRYICSVYCTSTATAKFIESFLTLGLI